MSMENTSYQTIIRQSDTMLLFASPKRYRDAHYAFTRGPRGDGLRGPDWRAIARDDEAAIGALFGCLPQWPGEFVERP